MDETHVGKERMQRLLQERQGRNLWDELMALRDGQRAAKEKAVWLIKGKDLPWETNKQGRMRWYMHPLVKNTCINTLMIFVQEIPPGSRSGRLQHPGDAVMYILEGEGYSMVDGQKHTWSKGDVVQLPVRKTGLVVQHFNTSKDKPVRFVQCEPNTAHSVGVDRATGWEQLEASPDYKP